jgi:hypothetical protein
MKKFFADLWAKIRSDATNAAALIGAFFGEILSNLDGIAAAFSDPTINQQVQTLIADATWTGRWLRLVSVVVMLASFKKLVQSPPKA